MAITLYRQNYLNITRAVIVISKSLLIIFVALLYSRKKKGNGDCVLGAGGGEGGKVSKQLRQKALVS